MGFTVGLILLLAATPEKLISYWAGGVSAMVGTVLYGYILENPVEGFWPKNN